MDATQFWVLGTGIAVVFGLAALGYNAMSTSPPYNIRPWVPKMWFSAALVVVLGEGIYFWNAFLLAKVIAIISAIGLLVYLLWPRLQRILIKRTKAIGNATKAKQDIIEDHVGLIETLTQMHQRLVALQQIKARQTIIRLKRFEKVNSTLADRMGTVKLENWDEFNKELKRRIIEENRVPRPKHRHFYKPSNWAEWANYRRGIEQAALSVALIVRDEQVNSKKWTLEDSANINKWMGDFHWGVQELRDNDTVWKPLDESLTDYLTDQKLRESISKHIELSLFYNNTCLMIHYSARFPKSIFAQILHSILIGSPISPANVNIALGEISGEIKSRLVEIGSHCQLGIEITETRVEPFGSTRSDTIFVDTIFRTQKRMQLARVSLECEASVLPGFISANISLPHYLSGNENHTLEFPLNKPPEMHSAALWYINEQMKIAKGESRSQGRLVVIADGVEWRSNLFLIPTHIDGPVVRGLNPNISKDAPPALIDNKGMLNVAGKTTLHIKGDTDGLRNREGGKFNTGELEIKKWEGDDQFVPLQNRNELLRTIAEAKIATIELADCFESVKGSEKQSPNVINTNLVSAFDKAQKRYKEAYESLGKEILVAGSTYEKILQPLYLFMQSSAILNASPERNIGTLLTYKHTLENMVTSVRNQIDKLSQPTSHGGDSH
jgi:hypothetical protein